MLAHRLRHELPDAIVQSASTIKYGRPPSAALTRSFLIEGHFLRVAGASKLCERQSYPSLMLGLLCLSSFLGYRFRTTAFRPVGD